MVLVREGGGVRGIPVLTKGVSLRFHSFFPQASAFSPT
jgi:hypothetical protein